MSDDCKYPNIKVELIGNSGNAMTILGAVKNALKRGGVSPEEVSEFFKDATSGDYDHLLQVVMSWVEVSGNDPEEDDEEDEEWDEICRDCGLPHVECECDYNEDEEDEEDETCEHCGELIDFCTCEDDSYGYAEQKNFD